MAKFLFELVGRERLLFSGQVDQVDVPGSEGDFGVLAGHAPLVAMLRPGILTIYSDQGPIRAMITGGFAEVGPNGLTVLADFAAPAEELDREVLAGQIKDLEEDVNDAAPARCATALRTGSISCAPCRPRSINSSPPAADALRMFAGPMTDCYADELRRRVDRGKCGITSWQRSRVC